jgi:epoxyqueuosine reductase
MNWTAELAAMVRTEALEAGFHLAGIAAADGSSGSLEAARFAEWVDAGRAGDMEYLKRRNAAGTLLREGVQVAIPWAKSVVLCALNYGTDSELPLSIETAGTDRGWIGRYAWSGRRQDREKGSGNREQTAEGAAQLVATDYHEELLSRLKRVEARLHQAVQCETKGYVDTGPIVERGLAAKAGVGWIGKNTCVINQEIGSWLLLGVIVTSLAVEVDCPDGGAGEGWAGEGGARFGTTIQALAADRCGSCTRCIDACPTDALVAPREMDASRCIAYLTIEKKETIATEFREAMGRQVFGCDICQDVCPWNQRHRRGGNRAAASAVTPGMISGMEPRPELVNPSLAWLAGMDAKEFKQWFRGSPLERTGRKRLHRNVALAMGNSGEREFIARLREWSESEDAVLAESARWAIKRILSSAERS